MLAVVFALCLASAASAADRIYWNNLYGNVISYANLDGSGGADLPIAASALDGPMGEAIDAVHGKIYWANYGVNGGLGTGTSIGVANLDGSDGHLVPITGVPVVAPHGVAVDPAAGKLYWTNEDTSMGAGTSWIGVSNLDGSGGAFFDPGAATMADPRGLALDKGAGKLYWANHGGQRVSVANLSGGGGSDIPTGSAHVQNPEGVALAPDKKRLYYGNYREPPDPIGETISWVDLGGSGGADLDTGAATRVEPHGVAIDPAANRIYWANFDANVISFASLDGGGGVDLPTPGATKDRPSMPVILKSPVPTDAPDVSGKAKPKAKLLCSRGKWAADLAESLLWRQPSGYTFAWKKNGNVVPGEASNSLTAHAVGDYQCVVGGINAAGTSYQQSASFATFKVGHVKLDPSTGTATLKVKLPGPGKVSVKGKTVVKERPAAAGSGLRTLSRKVKGRHAKLLIKPKGKAKRKLLRTGKAKVKATIAYHQKKTGASGTQKIKIKLKLR